MAPVSKEEGIAGESKRSVVSEAMQITIKGFEMLDVHQLYELLQLRSEVFVVEQECVYQDLDGKDGEAIHILGYKEGEIIAYTRVFSPGAYFPEASIGRVVVKQSFRGKQYGHDILQASIEYIEQTYGSTSIRLSAQQYLVDFYKSHGFTATGKGYLEDGIPHIAMLREGPLA